MTKPVDGPKKEYLRQKAGLFNGHPIQTIQNHILVLFQCSCNLSLSRLFLSSQHRAIKDYQFKCIFLKVFPSESISVSRKAHQIFRILQIQYKAGCKKNAAQISLKQIVFENIDYEIIEFYASKCQLNFLTLPKSLSIHEKSQIGRKKRSS